MSSTRRIRPKVYTVTEFACLFAVSPRVVRALIRKGEIPALRIGRSYRIPRTAANDYLTRALSPRSRSSPKPRTREVEELTGFLFPVGMMQ
jgi:excisionase family DNA binding protein